MNAVLIRRLILKDWYLSRLMLGVLGAVGAGAVGLLLLRNETSGFLGLITSFIALILLSNMLPTLTIVNERKHHNLALVMSLPISPADYTAAKILANVLAYFVVWAAIVGALLWIFVHASGFGGWIPFLILAALAPFCAFGAITAVALVGESEFGAILAMVATNISYSFIWFFLVRVPGVVDALKSPVPIWSPTIVTIIAAEVGLIALAIGAAFFFQSRKTDFI